MAKMGRPTDNPKKDTLYMRVTKEFLSAVDAWAEKNDVSRSEAIRRLVRRGLDEDLS